MSPERVEGPGGKDFGINPKTFVPNILIEVSSLAACSDYVIMQMKEIDERIVCHDRSLKIMQ